LHALNIEHLKFREALPAARSKLAPEALVHPVTCTYRGNPRNQRASGRDFDRSGKRQQKTQEKIMIYSNHRKE
jgi:hypothetical protein